METLQAALKSIYGMLGGNLDNVRSMTDIDAILGAISGLGVGDALKAAMELPAAPSDDGTYNLTVTVDDGEATYTWEAVEAAEPAADAGT